MNVIASCNRGWRFMPDDALESVRLAVECNIWPLYEVVNGVYSISYKPKNPIPVADYLKTQGRFSHFFKPGNEHFVEAYQKAVDSRWNWLLEMEESTKRVPFGGHFR
jgi:pyruvate ferredoxin oxidoreductase beta subunit